MAVEPLYNESLDKLLLIARIEPANDDNTLAAVEQAVRDVRLGFFSQLGRDRTLEIVTYPLVDNPTTDDELLRSSAASAEALWLTILLMQRLPVLFMDNSASAGDKFNDEPLTRDATGLQSSKDDLQSQLDNLLGELADESSNLDPSVKSALNGPDEPYLLSEHKLGGSCAY